MPTYNSLTDRTESGALIPEEYSHEIIQSVPTESTILKLARRLPNMSRKQHRLPILGSLPIAYFVTGDTGLKQTTEMSWKNKYINAEELAVIVPIPEVVLDDVDYDMWGEIRPRLVEAIGAVIDKAILYGTNKPSTWPDGIVPGAASAGNTLAVGSLGVGTDLYDDIMGNGGLLSLVENDGYMVTGHVAAMSLKSRLRGLRDSVGQPVFLRGQGSTSEGSMQSATTYELDGQSILFPINGAIDPATALDIAGQWDQLVYSIRQDITWKVLDQAVIQDGSGAIVYNLPQQDMVALRVVFRMGWELPNPITPFASNDATRYPFATLTP